MQLWRSLLEASNLNMGQRMPVFFFTPKARGRGGTTCRLLAKKLIEVDVMAVP